MNFWVMKTAKSFYNCKVRKSKNFSHKMRFLYNLKLTFFNLSLPESWKSRVKKPS